MMCVAAGYGEEGSHLTARTLKRSAKMAVMYRVTASASFLVMARGKTPTQTVTTGIACKK